MQHLEDGLLHALVDGEVPSAELAPIQAHLEGCAECRNRLEQTRSLAGESDQLIGFIDVPPSGERTRVPAAGVGPARVRAGLPGWIKPAALAASLILAVAIGYAGGRMEMLQDSAEGDSLSALGSYRLGADEPAPVEATPPTQIPPESAAGNASAPLRRRTDPLREQANERDMAKLDQAGGQRRAEPGAAEKTESLVVTLQAPAPQAVRDRLTTDTLRIRGATSIAAAPSAGRSAQKAPAVPAPALAVEEMRAIAAVAATPIDFFEAVRLLGGQLRLIEGLTPSRLEAIGSAVRVIYALPGGELVLEQRRDADSIAIVLTAPWLSGDSLGRLREKISR